MALLGLSLFAGASCGSGSTCGLGLVGRVSPFAGRSQPFPSLEPGQAAFKNVTIPSYEGLEIDILNESTPEAPVDVFLTAVTCEKLFTGTYAGGASTPLCSVLYGPVAHGVTGKRKKVSPGTYRIFVQAYPGNLTPATFNVEVGLWSDDCRTPIVGPAAL
jgi:hypothetical protein